MRISVTSLDAYRYYRDNEDASLDDLLARLRRELPPTEAMMAGSALHAALEHAQADAEVLQADGYTFRFVADCELPLPAVRELKGEIEMQTSIGPVTLVGIVDAIGSEIQDHKFTARFDAERYADSFQWRCYLHMFGAHRFVYNVFEGREVKPMSYDIHAFHRLPLFSYPGMREEVQREIDEFARFLDRHMKEPAILATVDANALCTQA